ncbi:hypothetical protein [Reyranella sp.]|uniref:hypothetical protein n=1 Tax=Reyranella sp. TaxID=1929291 RepID=UPI002731DCD5|nr:hypothetical protein [Reyranella sp.]MDP2374275.1 hypothetical protein [Reyranella sp.]
MFGLFASTQRKATDAAIEGARPYIALLQDVAGPGIPSGFWEDRYVVGFFQFTTAFFAKHVTQGKASGATLGFATADALTALSNRNGRAIMSRAADLTFAKDPEHARGADDAAALIYYAFGFLKDEDRHPLVKKALGGSKTTDRILISTLMLRESLFAEVERIKAEGAV